MLKIDNFCNFTQNNVYNYYNNYIKLHNSTLFSNLQSGTVTANNTTHTATNDNLIRNKLVKRIKKDEKDEKVVGELDLCKLKLLLLKYNNVTDDTVEGIISKLLWNNKILSEKMYKVIYYNNLYNKLNKLYNKLSIDEDKFIVNVSYEFTFYKFFYQFYLHFYIQSAITIIPILPFNTVTSCITQENKSVNSAGTAAKEKIGEEKSVKNVAKKSGKLKNKTGLTKFDEFVLGYYFGIERFKSINYELTDATDKFKYLLYDKTFIMANIQKFAYPRGKLKVNLLYRDILTVQDYLTYLTLSQQLPCDNTHNGLDCDVVSLMNLCLELNVNPQFLYNINSFNSLLNFLNTRISSGTVNKSVENNTINSAANTINNMNSMMTEKYYKIEGTGLVEVIDVDRLLFQLLISLHHNHNTNLNFILFLLHSYTQNTVNTVKCVNTVESLENVDSVKSVENVCNEEPSTEAPELCMYESNVIIYVKIFKLIYNPKYGYFFQYYLRKMMKIINSQVYDRSTQNYLKNTVTKLLNKFNSEIIDHNIYYNKKYFLLQTLQSLSSNVTEENVVEVVSVPEVYKYCYNVLIYYMNNLSYKIDDIIILTINIIIHIYTHNLLNCSNLNVENITNSAASVAAVTAAVEENNSVKNVAVVAAANTEKNVREMCLEVMERYLMNNMHIKITLYTMYKLMREFDIKIDSIDMTEIKYTRNKKIEKSIYNNIFNRSNIDFRYFVLYLIQNISPTCPRRKLYQLLDLALIYIPSLLKYIIIHILNDFILSNTCNSPNHYQNLFDPVENLFAPDVPAPIAAEENDVASGIYNLVEKLNGILLYNIENEDKDYLSLEILYYLLDYINSTTTHTVTPYSTHSTHSTHSIHSIHTVDKVNTVNKNVNSERSVNKELMRIYSVIMSSMNVERLFKCSYYIKSYTRTIHIINSITSVNLVNYTLYDDYLVDITHKYPISICKPVTSQDYLHILAQCYLHLGNHILYNYLNTVDSKLGDLTLWQLHTMDTTVNTTEANAASTNSSAIVGNTMSMSESIKLLYVSIRENNMNNYVKYIQNLSTLNLTQYLHSLYTRNKIDTDDILCSLVTRSKKLRSDNVIEIYKVYKKWDEKNAVNYILRLFNLRMYNNIIYNEVNDHQLYQFIKENLTHEIQNSGDFYYFKLFNSFLQQAYITYHNLLIPTFNSVNNIHSVNGVNSVNNVDMVQIAEENSVKIGGIEIEMLLMKYYCGLDNNLQCVIVNNILRLLSVSSNYKLYYLYSNYLYQLIINKLVNSHTITLNPNHNTDDNTINLIQINTILSSTSVVKDTVNSVNSGNSVVKDSRSVMGVDGIIGITNLYDYSNLLLHTLNIHFLTLLHYSTNATDDAVRKIREENKPNIAADDAAFASTDTKEYSIESIMIRIIYIIIRYSREGNVELERNVILSEELVTFFYKQMFTIFNHYINKIPILFYYIVINQLIGSTVHKLLNNISITVLSKLLQKYPNVVLWYITYFKYSKNNTLNSIYTKITNTGNTGNTVKISAVSRLSEVIVRYNVLYNELYKLSLNNTKQNDELKYLQNLKQFFSHTLSQSTGGTVGVVDMSKGVDCGILLPNYEILLFSNIYYNVNKEYITNILDQIITLKSKQKPKIITFITNLQGSNNILVGSKYTNLDPKHCQTAENTVNSGNTVNMGKRSFILKNELKGDLRKDLRSMDSIKYVNKLIEYKFQYKLPVFNVVIISEIIGLIQFLPNLITLKTLYNDVEHNNQVENPISGGNIDMKKLIMLYIKYVNSKHYHNSYYIYNTILKMLYNTQGTSSQGTNSTNSAAPNTNTVNTVNSMIVVEKGVKSAAPGSAGTSGTVGAGTVNEYYNSLMRYIMKREGVIEYNKLYEMSNKFNLSCSIWNIFGYIIGLGDRHTENILIDVKNGDMVHVDYDCLFDKGLKLLIPELVPFRLTPIILHNLGTNVNVCGLYYNNSLSFYEMLTTNKEIIKLILYNFILDPMIKWDNIQNKITLKLTNHINIFTTTHNNTVNKMNTTNNPGNSVNNVNNPGNSVNKMNNPGNSVNKMNNVNNVGKGEVGMEVIYINEKVNNNIYINELIKSSINKHLLSRMFVGWAPWI
ncbi:Phosphatidylinositol 3- and 4-kinase family protein [Theileria parva strain Muguga]|uniref:Uncharacterized protein n=1 Tax=Theileria parva TaxID=5875 RepID=Q4N452_THEPA|nr:Phosphatidylinositol 3- and 4-kinase family protein [Theileria parva strain Muguga]EAN33071.1 Phosphatidylinositol 3- and 4-kinase family protein [Theileria parva strain Muguga]|eukprot:XP_765354.1 hypothetical protein [Theileria parva strain Muguga]